MNTSQTPRRETALRTRAFNLLLASILVVACGDTESKDSNANNVNNTNNTNNVNNANNANNANDMGMSDMPLPDGAIATGLGPVSGTGEDGVNVYRGIPYAAPPLGELRFKPTADHPGWTDVLEADAFGPKCPQRDTATMTDEGDEDCLQLNVWSPEGAEDLPVMVFIHGGAFVGGSAVLPLYNGINIAKRDVVVVTLNYRLGALGFLATDTLIEENGGTAGNWGIYDQIQALEWVQDNIAAFGGSPDNVTIFGESAGGVSVCVHLGSELSTGLFDRGIIESGAGCTGWPDLDQDRVGTQSGTSLGADFVAAAGCDAAVDTNQCLRDLPALDLVAAAYDLSPSGIGTPPFGPIIDGTILTAQTLAKVRARTDNDVPVITGSNADEATIFTAAIRVPTVAAYEMRVRATLGPFADDVLAIYPASSFDTPKAAYNALFSDIAFICPALNFADSAANGEPVYTYHFTRAFPQLGAFHGLELVYVFGTFDSVPAYTPTTQDTMLSDEMMSHWTDFAKTGDPSWPAYTRGDPVIQIFDYALSRDTQIREGRCGRLKTIGLLP